MRPLLLALVLLPFAAQAHDDHDHDHAHGSLGKHEHGVAQLNVALDGKTLELELDSPAMNLVGFEHAASTDADKAAVAKGPRATGKTAGAVRPAGHRRLLGGQPGTAESAVRRQGAGPRAQGEGRPRT